MFGSIQKAFNKAHANQLLQSGKIDEVKNYIKSYFAKNIEYMYFYDPKQSIKVITYSNFEKQFPKKVFKNGKFSISEWFLNEDFDLFELGNHAFKESVYEDKYGTKYINQHKGFQWKTEKKMDEFDEFQLKGIDMVNKHLKEVICGNNAQQYEFMLNWLSNVAHGRKNEALIYLQTSQGTGKSIILEFLITAVFGENIAKLFTKSHCFKNDGWNSELLGYSLVLAEDLHSMNSKEYFDLYNTLKNIATAERLDIKQKHKDGYSIKNILNFILSSNHECLPLEQTDRRFLILDVSENRRGDMKYFTKLSKYIGLKRYKQNAMKVGEAYYWWLYHYGVEKDLKKWDSLKALSLMPITNSKKHKIIAHLDPHFKEIKEKFLYNGLGFKKIEFAEIHKLLNRVKPIPKNQLSQKLKSVLNLSIKQTTNGKRVYDISYDHLLKAFDKNNFIDWETDDIKKPDGYDNKDIDENKDVDDDLIKSLKKEIKELKKKLKQYENAETKKETKKTTKKQTKKEVSKADIKNIDIEDVADEDDDSGSDIELNDDLFN